MFKFKKVNGMRALACLLVLFSLLTVWAFAETTATDPNTSVEAVETVAVEAEENDELELNFVEGIKNIVKSTGFAKSFNEDGTFEWRNYAMIAVACFLLYLAIVKQFEPLLLLPISFGMLLANLPAAGMMAHPSFTFYNTLEEALIQASKLGKDATDVIMRFNEELAEVMIRNNLDPHNINVFGTFEQCLAMAKEIGRDASDIITQYAEDGSVLYALPSAMAYSLQTANGGLLYYLYQGVKLGIYPPLIFMGVGAMTDFGPLLANPKSLLLGAAAQLGIFLTFIGAKLLGFSGPEAGSIGIIGGADGPTAIFVTTKLAPHLLGPIAVAAYSYMALVPVIQPPIMKALTTDRERKIRMGQLRQVSKTELIIFPIMVTIAVSLLLPDAATLVGMLMLGNLMRVCGVVERINKTAQNELCNIVTIFLGLTVGATTQGATFLTLDTIKIVVLGVVAFGCGTAGGVLLAKLMNVLAGGNSINPLIGSAGVSAVPMAARVSQKVGQEYDPGNFLLMHAMGPNVAGVIGSAVAAGVFIALLG